MRNFHPHDETHRFQKKAIFLPTADFAKSDRPEGFVMDLARPPDNGESRGVDLVRRSVLEDAEKQSITEGKSI
ncbi:hypothetical protein F2Q68_00020322 [Brassica cretica]|uniref:Uncharacterized protein n=1 Tax=Brassica cretica TaxID=69181 RepID=A0A8S9G3W0_BRACR|nr:hypothetical protein F2Q68_00020322 [Brassica cretica]